MPGASTGPLDWLDRYVRACAHLPCELIVHVSFITQSSTNAYLSVFVFLHPRPLLLSTQSFCASLHQELKEYYRLLSVLHSQVNKISADNEGMCNGKSQQALDLK